MLAHQFATMVEVEQETSVAMTRLLKTKFLGRYHRQGRKRNKYSATNLMAYTHTLEHPLLENMVEKNAGLLAAKLIRRNKDGCIGIVELCYGHTTHSMVGRG